MLLDLIPATMERHDLFDNRDQHRQTDESCRSHQCRAWGTDGSFRRHRRGRPEWSMHLAFRSPPLYDMVGRIAGCEAFQEKNEAVSISIQLLGVKVR